MKEASGELNLTVITVIALGVVAGIATWLWPKVQESIGQQWNSISTNQQNSGVKPE